MKLIFNIKLDWLKFLLGYNNNEPIEFYGSSGALDLFIPTVDRLFSI